MRWSRKDPMDIFKWHRWFAWYPVQTATMWFWLEPIARRRDYSNSYWEYADYDC